MSLAIYSQHQFSAFGCYTMPTMSQTQRQESILYKSIMTDIYRKIKMKSVFRFLRKRTDKVKNVKIPKSLIDKIEKVRKKPLKEVPISEKYTTSNGTYSTSVWQLDKHQDYVRAIGNNMIVADGHGTDIVSDWLKSLSDNELITIFNQKNPLSYLNDMLLNQPFSTVGSGACVTIVKTYSTYVDVFYSGDTKAQVYVNHQKVKETDKHDASNPKEKERVKAVGAYFVKEKMMEVLEPTPSKIIRLTQIDGERIRFDKDTFLQMSQCLGHSKQGTPGKSTTKETGYFRVDFSEKDEVLVIAASDGVWDVTHHSVDMSIYKTAGSVVFDTCLKWYCDFEFVHPQDHHCSKCKAKKNNDDIVTIQKGLASDDISACVWYRKGKQ